MAVLYLPLQPRKSYVLRISVIASGQSKPPRVEIPDDGRFIGKPYGAVELFGQVDDLMRKS